MAGAYYCRTNHSQFSPHVSVPVHEEGSEMGRRSCNDPNCGNDWPCKLHPDAPTAPSVGPSEPQPTDLERAEKFCYGSRIMGHSTKFCPKCQALAAEFASLRESAARSLTVETEDVEQSVRWMGTLNGWCIDSPGTAAALNARLREKKG